jgi:predicted DNA-binding antitoxin AbrB/MazE fold protein
MTITVEATYEDGVLKPTRPLPFKEHEQVKVTVHARSSPLVEAYGIMGWKGDAAALERIALDPNS